MHRPLKRASPSSSSSSGSWIASSGSTSKTSDRRRASSGRSAKSRQPGFTIVFPIRFLQHFSKADKSTKYKRNINKDHLSYYSLKRHNLGIMSITTRAKILRDLGEKIFQQCMYLLCYSSLNEKTVVVLKTTIIHYHKNSGMI